MFIQLRQAIIITAMLLCAGISMAAEIGKTAATIFDALSEEVLVTPHTLIMEKGQIVKDATARSGWALFADPVPSPGKGVVSFGYTYKQDPGNVRFTYRLKVADNSDPRPVVLLQVCVWDNDLKQNPNNPEIPIRGTDFTKPNVYQYFSFEIPKGETGFGGWGITTTGISSIWCDGVNVTQVSRFTAQKILELVNVPIKPADLHFAPSSLRVHEAGGLFMAEWQVADAVKLLSPKTVEWTRSYLTVHPQHTALAGFPKKWDDLYSYSIIVLNNVPAKAVSVTGCVMLKQYLDDGGTVLIMGDTHSLAQGLWAETSLGPLLPVVLSAPSDVLRARQPLLLTPVGNRLTALDWAQQPYSIYYHHATVTPDAQVLCAAGNIPLIVERKVGKGRIIMCLLSVLGEKVAGVPGVPFWQWHDWSKLLADMLSPSGAIE